LFIHKTDFGMTTFEVKNNLHLLVDNVEDSSVLQRAFAVLSGYDDKDFWDELSDEDKKSIDRGLADVAANRVKGYNEVMNKYRK
jgi:hypothetical protein